MGFTKAIGFTRRQDERRIKFRFAIERELRYKVAEEGVVVASGSGQSINIGSGGVAFATEVPLRSSCGFVELSMSWPVLLDETCPMRLIVFGRVLRCTGRKAVCTIDKYEFRTQSRTFQASVASRDTTLQRWADGLRKDNVRMNA